MKILLAVDGSKHSETALHEVRSRPWPRGSVVRVFTSMQQPFPAPTALPWGSAVGPGITSLSPGNPAYSRLNEQLRTRAEVMVEHTAESLRQLGLAAHATVGTGDPRSAIVDEAKDWGADLIVLGSRGLSGIKRWLLGSVAQAVVAHAPCSVEVVRRAPDAT